MANNCLQTKLKSVVNNDSLPVLGTLKCVLTLQGNVIGSNPHFAPILSTGRIYITLLDANATFTSVTGNASIEDAKHGSYTNSYLDSLVVSGVTNNGTVNVLVKSKYGIHGIGSKVSALRTEDLKYSLALNYAFLSTGKIQGSLADFSELTALTRLQLGYDDNVIGNISSLGKLLNLTEINIASIYDNYTGNWKEFVEAQRANSRISCEGLTVVDVYYCKIAFGRRSHSRIGAEGQSAILKWSENKISLQNDTSKNVLTIGYTQEEAESAFPEYTIELCD